MNSDTKNVIVNEVICWVDEYTKQLVDGSIMFVKPSQLQPQVFPLVVVITWRHACEPLEQVSSSVSGFDDSMCQQEGN